MYDGLFAYGRLASLADVMDNVCQLVANCCCCRSICAFQTEMTGHTMRGIAAGALLLLAFCVTMPMPGQNFIVAAAADGGGDGAVVSPRRMLAGEALSTPECKSQSLDSVHSQGKHYSQSVVNQLMIPPRCMVMTQKSQ